MIIYPINIIYTIPATILPDLVGRLGSNNINQSILLSTDARCVKDGFYSPKITSIACFECIENNVCIFNAHV